MSNTVVEKLFALLVSIIILIFSSNDVHADDRTYNKKDLLALTQAIYYEARAESSTGQQAVANVIMNRVQSKCHPNTVHGVIWHSKAFSFTHDGRTESMPNKQARLKAYNIALLALNNVLEDITNGADHYYAHNLVSPNWSKAMQKTVQLGGHTFLLDNRLHCRVSEPF